MGLHDKFFESNGPNFFETPAAILTPVLAWSPIFTSECSWYPGTAVIIFGAQKNPGYGQGGLDGLLMICVKCFKNQIKESVIKLIE